MARRRKYELRKKNGLFALNITSMTDMFTILLVFLLQTYSSAEVQLSPDAAIRLPQSSTELNPVRGVKINLSKQDLKFDDKVIAQLENKDFKASDTQPSDNLFIQPLFDKLQEFNAAQKDTEERKKITQVLLQADAELPYHVVRKVFYTASMAGFPQMKMITMVGN